MLHANELMVDDWVLYHNDGCIDAENDVAPYDENVQIRTSDFERDECFWADLDPIPLTPEILEKNGFDVSDPEVSIYRFEEDGQVFRFCLRRMYNKDNRPNGYSFYASANVLAIIDFVHQLQHCLKLVGIEKEIEL